MEKYQYLYQFIVKYLEPSITINFCVESFDAGDGDKLYNEVLKHFETFKIKMISEDPDDVSDFYDDCIHKGILDLKKHLVANLDLNLSNKAKDIIDKKIEEMKSKTGFNSAGIIEIMKTFREFEEENNISENED